MSRSNKNGEVGQNQVVTKYVESLGKINQLVEKGMSFKDRLLFLRRASLLAFDPDVAVVGLSYVQKLPREQSVGIKRLIYTDPEVAQVFSLRDSVDGFLNHAKNSIGLGNTLTNFVEICQSVWNKENPNDILDLFGEGLAGGVVTKDVVSQEEKPKSEILVGFEADDNLNGGLESTSGGSKND